MYKHVQGPGLSLSLKGKELPAGAGLVTRGAALWEGRGRAQLFYSNGSELGLC